MDADYILFQVAALELPQEFDEPLYHFGDKGGDVTKAFWMVKIADLPLADYYNPDGNSFSDKFWNETLLGKLIPFTTLIYVDPNNPELQSETYRSGYIPVFVKDV